MNKSSLIILLIVVFIALFVLPKRQSEIVTSTPVAIKQKITPLPAAFKVNILSSNEEKNDKTENSHIPQLQFEFKSQQLHIEWFLKYSKALVTTTGNQLGELTQDYTVKLPHSVDLKKFVPRSIKRLDYTKILAAGAKQVHVLWPINSFNHLTSTIQRQGIKSAIVRIEEYGLGYLLLSFRNAVSENELGVPKSQRIKVYVNN